MERLFYVLKIENRLHCVCFTGHRPEKLDRSGAEIAKDFETEIRKAITDKMNVFIPGMARGTDIMAAQIVLNLRAQNPQIKLVCACPYFGFENDWSSDWQAQYRSVLKTADVVKYICKNYSRDCFQKRNEWMVNHSARVIAVFNGKGGGTKNTIALKKNPAFRLF